MTLIKALLVAWTVLTFLTMSSALIGRGVCAALELLTGCEALAQLIGFGTGAFCLITGVLITVFVVTDHEENE